MSRPGRAWRAAAVAAGLLALTIQAPARAANFEVTPMAGLRTGGEFVDKNSGQRYEFDDDGSIGLTLGWDLDGQSFVEFGLMTTSTLMSPIEIDTSLISYEIDVTDLQIGGHYAWDSGPVKPFILGSLGLTIFDPTFPDTDEEMEFSFAVGGGAKGYFAKHFGIRGDLRLLGSSFGGSSEIFCAGDECLRPKGTVIFQFEGRIGLIVRF
jgi:hypothetical protein